MGNDFECILKSAGIDKSVVCVGWVPSLLLAASFLVRSPFYLLS